MMVETFFLYGEAPCDAAQDFLHVEPLDARSRPAHWHIRAHRHEDLNHLFLFTGGAGEALVAVDRLVLVSPCVLFVPAGLVHGFRFSPDMTGRVLTVSSAFLARLEAETPELAGVFTSVHVAGAEGETDWLRACMERLARELAWSGKARSAAAHGIMLAVLAAAARLRPGPSDGLAQGADARLLARLQDMIEVRFAQRLTVDAYASALGVSVSRLRAACRAAGASPPLRQLQARQMLEARRALMHGHMRVGEIASLLGYEDAAYFVRLFKRHVGVPPARFRRGRIAA